jgi:serine protease AprX
MAYENQFEEKKDESKSLEEDMRRVLHIGSSLILVLAVLFGAMGSPAPVRAQSGAIVDQKLDSALAAKLASVTPLTPLEVVVVFSDISAASRVRSLATKFFQMQTLPIAGAILPAGKVRDLASWPEVYSVTLNQPLKYFLHESVSLIKADQVWSTFGETGSNATVAIIDSGIDATHPDLQYGAKVVQNVKVLPYELSQENVQITDTSSGHGTHVAGTVGGTGTASEGYYRGVAPGVRLVGLGAGEGLSILTATQAYDWVLTNHARYDIRVVSNSWGSTGGSVNLRNPVVIASLEAYNRGILSVFAAGNDGGYDVMNPYSIAPWVLSVAAGDKAGALADFSSRGVDGDYFKHPDITAPGVAIYSTRTKTIGITALDPLPNPVNPLWTPYYTMMDGTSMATPHVSGAAALLLSHNPSLSPDQVMELLTSNATPMSGYALHEAGYGYMDILAAYQDSLDDTGNLQAFLSGSRLHRAEEVYGLDPNYPVEYSEQIFTGFVPAGATEYNTGISTGPIDHQINLTNTSGVLYVDVNLTWTPQAEDAFDMTVLDPDGLVLMSSGNGLAEGEQALFVPHKPGVYTIRLQPFAAVGVDYTMAVKTAYGTQPDNWPPDSTPAYDNYLGLDAIFKTYGVLGLGSAYFRGGDEGFIDFILTRADGFPQAGQAANMQVALTDRNGTIAFLEPAVSDQGGGVYRISFNTGSADWKGVAGPITFRLLWSGAGTVKIPLIQFFLNHLEVSLESTGTSYRSGDNVSFTGNVAQLNSVTAADVETTPLGSAPVTVSLVSADGQRLTSTSVQTDLQGNFSGSIVAPAEARGKAMLVAESSFQDPTIVLGPAEWYGSGQVELTFPGNLPPTAALRATSQTDAGKKFQIHIQASGSDPDGAADISSITLTLTDSKSRLLKRWSLADFSKTDDLTWLFESVYRVSGKEPWTLTLTVTDRAGQSATESVTITK